MATETYTKGETAGGWIHVLKGKTPVALVHPKHVDKFIASDDMYEALRELLRESEQGNYDDVAPIASAQGLAQQALAKAKITAEETGR